MFMNDFTAWCQYLICAEAPAFFPTVAFVSSVEGQICLGFIMKSFDLPDILWGALEPLHCENHWSKRWVFKAKRTIFSGLLDAQLSLSFHPVPSLFRAGALCWVCVHPSPWAASGPHIPLWGSGQQAQTHPWWCRLSPCSSESSHSRREDGLHRDFRKEPASYASGGSQCPWSAGDHKDAGRLWEREFPCWPGVRGRFTHSAGRRLAAPRAWALLQAWSAWIGLSHWPSFQLWPVSLILLPWSEPSTCSFTTSPCSWSFLSRML